MGEIDIVTGEVHAMGNSARDVADTSLTKAKKAMTGAIDDTAGMGMHRFMTRQRLDSLVAKRRDCAKNDVTKMNSVGDKLHAVASAVENGDIDSAGQFEGKK